MTDSAPIDRPWDEGDLPANVRVGLGSVINGKLAFKRFRARQDPGLVLGSNCTMDGVHFATGPSGRIMMGDYCFFTNVVLLCDLELRVGNRVAIGWNTVISDSDFHPLEPALRVADAIACSPTASGRPRPPVECKPVIIEDDVWIGASCTILKGVRIGRGAFIEPGAIVTRDVPAGARAMGNPAQIIG